MGFIHVTVSVRAMAPPGGVYTADFLVDTGATDSMVPGIELRWINVPPAGKTAYELADGSIHQYPFAVMQIEFMGEVTGGRVIFGPDGAEPILGVTALESVGIAIEPATRTLRRLPAVPLKSMRPSR